MSRRLVPLTLDSELPEPCSSCTFWESVDLDPAAKATWLSGTLLDWGSCGTTVMEDTRVVGYATYAPAHLFPRLATFATAPISADAVLLAALRVVEDRRGTGVGRMLVQGMAGDLVRRGVRAVETVATVSDFGPACLIPAPFLLSVGFKTTRAHPRHPRLRLDLRSTASWREDLVEATIGRLRVQKPLGAYRSFN